jgi:hypothetical protein
MSEGNIAVRLAKAAKEFNIGIATIVDFLSKKGHKVDNSPNSKLSPEMYGLLVKEFQSEKTVKESAKKSNWNISIISKPNQLLSKSPKLRRRKLMKW